MASPEAFNLFDDATRECPFAYFASVRHERPVYFMDELDAYYVSRYEDVRYVKKHPEIFSNNIFEYGSRGGSERNIAESYRAEHGWRRVSTLQRTDPPVHTRYRKTHQSRIHGGPHPQDDGLRGNLRQRPDRSVHRQGPMRLRLGIRHPAALHRHRRSARRAAGEDLGPEEMVRCDARAGRRFRRRRRRTRVRTPGGRGAALFRRGHRCAAGVTSGRHHFRSRPHPWWKTRRRASSGISTCTSCRICSISC